MTCSRCPSTLARRWRPGCVTAPPPLWTAVFTRIMAPRQGLTAGGVTQAVAAAAGGLGTIYAHRLRHSAGIAMLAQGGSLAEIGQVLRYRRPATTRNLHEGGHRSAARSGPVIAGSVVMTGLRAALAGYLDLRRSLGFNLTRDEKLLEQFTGWLEDRGAATATVADALAWATLPVGGSPGWLRIRITVVRGFAAYLATLDPSAEVLASSPMRVRMLAASTGGDSAPAAAMSRAVSSPEYR